MDTRARAHITDWVPLQFRMDNNKMRLRLCLFGETVLSIVMFFFVRVACVMCSAEWQ